VNIQDNSCQWERLCHTLPFAAHPPNEFGIWRKKIRSNVLRGECLIVLLTES
jgi:hypothetical protein